MKVNALIASPKDSVVTLTDKVSVGDQVMYFLNDELVSVTALGDVPQYHKLAVKAVKQGDPVIKYGEVIGIAKADIRPGEHVHTHNLSSDGR